MNSVGKHRRTAESSQKAENEQAVITGDEDWLMYSFNRDFFDIGAYVLAVAER
jgi:hypothetical protein